MSMECLRKINNEQASRLAGQLRVWQKADELVFEIYRMTKKFPKDEMTAIQPTGLPAFQLVSLCAWSLASLSAYSLVSILVYKRRK